MKRFPIFAAILVAFTLVPGLVGADADVAFVDPVDGSWYVPNEQGGYTAFAYGESADTPIVGDWDCDGADTPGRFHSGHFYLRNSNGDGSPDVSFYFGGPGDRPMVGDWNGDGCDTVAVHRPHDNTVYMASHLRTFAGRAEIPVSGDPFVWDFDGDGRDELASYRAGSGLVVVGADAQGPGDGRVSSLIYDGSVVASASQVAYDLSLSRLTPLVGAFGSTCVTDCEGGRPSLAPGDEGAWVADLRTRLAAVGFRPGSGDGYDDSLEGAVLAFQKYYELERDGLFHSNQWELLDHALAIPYRLDSPDRVEVDLDRQILFLILDHQLAGVIPVSSANGDTYTSYNGNTVTARTPEGDFAFFRSESGWYRSYLGGLYEPFFFRGGYAIHGSSSVPAYPASHGCIRTQLWDQDWLKPQLDYGMDVFVYGVRTEAPTL